MSLDGNGDYHFRGCTLPQKCSHELRGERQRKNTPEDSSGHMPMRLSEGTSIQQVVEISADAEFGFMSIPEWARKPVELRSPGPFSQLSGVGRRI